MCYLDTEFMEVMDKVNNYNILSRYVSFLWVVDAKVGQKTPMHEPYRKTLRSNLYVVKTTVYSSYVLVWKQIVWISFLIS